MLSFVTVSTVALSFLFHPLLKEDLWVLFTIYYSNDLKQLLIECVMTQAAVWSSRILSLSMRKKCGWSLGFSGMDWARDLFDSLGFKFNLYHLLALLVLIFRFLIFWSLWSVNNISLLRKVALGFEVSRGKGPAQSWHYIVATLVIFCIGEAQITPWAGSEEVLPSALGHLDRGEGMEHFIEDSCLSSVEEKSVVWREVRENRDKLDSETCILELVLCY